MSQTNRHLSENFARM